VASRPSGLEFAWHCCHISAVSLKPRVRLIRGSAAYAGLVLAAFGYVAVVRAWADNTVPPNSSKEPIITLQDGSTPTTGISGSLQVPNTSPAPTQGAVATSATYVTFAIRQQDWSDASPAVPTTLPTGIVGPFTDTWTYTGTTSTHNYHFNVTSNQEGTPFYVVVKTTVAGSAPTYTKVGLVMGRAN